jgi:hypothetical protein
MPAAHSSSNDELILAADERTAPRGVPLVRALLAQIAAGILVAVYLEIPGEQPVNPLLLQAVLAALTGQALRLPYWWLPINAAFVPAALVLRDAGVAPMWFLLAFAVLLIVFWNTYRTRVPLYLSSRHACARLAELIPQGAPVRLLDLGCGFGGVLSMLRSLRPAAYIVGLELAPLPSWLAKLRMRKDGASRVERRDFWDEDFSQYDIVYAFLSPEPMPKLWRKARMQMRPNTLFVSNTFVVPEVEPDLTLPFGANGARALYVWRIRR